MLVIKVSELQTDTLNIRMHTDFVRIFWLLFLLIVKKSIYAQTYFFESSITANLTIQNSS